MKPVKIAPSILSADFSEMASEVRFLAACGADLVHCDVMDGVFVNNITFGIKMIEDIRQHTSLPLDCHLMIVHPEKYVERFAKAGADIITVHYEACKDNLKEVLQLIKSTGVKCGAVINPDTPVSAIADVIPLCDMVLLMSVFPGFGGQKFIPEVLDKVRELRSIIDASGMDIDVEIDGGVTTENVEEIKAAGADIIVAGSAVFKAEDRRKAIGILKGQIYEDLILALNSSGTAYTVVGCKKDAEKVVIPARLNGLPVVEIGNNAFEGCENLKEVVFPAYSEEDEAKEEVFCEVGDYAFKGCVSLKKVELPKGVKEIGWGAFMGCTSLVAARYHTPYIGNYAFSHCENLESVSPLLSVGDGTFSHCKKLKEFPVRQGLDEIGEDAFEHCYSLTEITIPASTESIGDLAFRGCRGLKKVVFEETEGWQSLCRYTGKYTDIDVSDPEDCAEALGRIDFDDGPAGWRRK